jgi:MSHA pilin protein MshA
MHRHASASDGFTLVELIVTITVLAVLAAFLLPRVASLDSSARIASVNALAGALNAAATQTYALCMTSAATSGCNNTSSAWQGTINGQYYWLNYGWPDAGDALNDGQIDAQLSYDGFTAVLVSSAETQFQLKGAPTPANCSVSYFDGYYTPPKYHLVVSTAGC